MHCLHDRSMKLCGERLYRAFFQETYVDCMHMRVRCVRAFACVRACYDSHFKVKCPVISSVQCNRFNDL